MKKNDCHVFFTTGLIKYLIMAKLAIILVLATSFQLFAMDGASQQKINLELQNKSIIYVINTIEKKYDYRFVYSDSSYLNKEHVDIYAKNASIDYVMQEILKTTNLSYKKINKDLVVIIGTAPVSQQIIITGKIIDENGMPLGGVSIVEKGTTNGTTTNDDGTFTIQVKDGNAVLVVTNIGYQTQEVSVLSNANPVITLVSTTGNMEEVLVVGYGTVKKRDVIGSVSSIKKDVLETPAVSSNFNTALQGQAAGVSVQTSSGRPGADVDIRIRGESSINANTAPLWIVDGVPIVTNTGMEGNWSANQSPMSLINASDIESIEILKDAAATAIYGSRGSNGVILVTTKSGRSGRPVLTVDLATGISKLPSQSPKFVNTKQWFEFQDASKRAGGETTPYNLNDDWYGGRKFSLEKLTRAQAEAINTDWRKVTMRTGNFQNVNASVTGGNEAVRYFVSGNYRHDNGVMQNEFFKRFGVRTNVDVNVSQYLLLGTKINLSQSKSNRGKNNYLDTDQGNDSGGWGGFSNVNSITVPFEPVYSLINPNEYYNPYAGNAVALQDPNYMIEDLTAYRALASVYGQYIFPFLKELSARAEASVDYVQANRNNWISDKIRALSVNNNRAVGQSMAQDGASTGKTTNYNFYLTYNKDINNHGINVVGGTEAQRSTSWYRRMIGEKLVGNYKELGRPGQFNDMYSGMQPELYLLSYFARANYKYKDRYLLGASIRRDGISVFRENNRWSTFLSLSAGWIISDEAFMGDFGRNNFLKLRGSFGQTGNAGIPGGLDVTRYEEGLPYGGLVIQATNGTLVRSIGVPTLRWETTNNKDIGLDFGFMNNRINGSIAYYNKYVKDLLLQSALPPSAGVPSIWGNIGDLVNKGVELSVNSVNVKRGKFQWNTTFNVAYNKNEIKKLTPDVDAKGTGMITDQDINKVGYPIRNYYLADFAGVNPQTGLNEIYVLDKDHYNQTGDTRRMKNKAGQDSTMILTPTNAGNNYFHLKDKSGIPKYYGGLNNRFIYGAFDLGFLITFSGGNYIYDQFRRDLVYHNNGEILQDVYDNYWKKPGDNAKYQRLKWKTNIKMEDGTTLNIGDQRTYSSQFLYKGDFIKFKSVTLGYTLPANRIKAFKGLRIYGMLENLHTFTKYPGYDPEGLGWVYQWDVPQLFSASLGVSVKL